MRKNLISLTCVALCLANTSYAVDNYLVNGDNFSYSYNVYRAGEEFSLDEDSKKSAFTIPYSYISSLFSASKNWASVINISANLNPVTYALVAENEYNAAAGSPYVDVEGKPYRVTLVNATINGLKPTGPKEVLDTFPVDGFVFLGLGIDEDRPGWEPYSGLHSLYHGELPDLHVVMLHEIMHSLGITSAVSQVNEEKGDKTYYFAEEGGNLSVLDKDVRIYTGDTSVAFNPSLEIKTRADMSVGEGEDFDVIKYSPYYVGETTLKVLSGEADYNNARQAIIDNGGLTNYSITYESSKIPYPQVYGLPIHNADDDEIDLSHIELRNSFMSHQSYRNWMIPMEAELAVLKDIGYDVDLRKYFGKSYYLNNITDTFTTGYSEWNGSTYTGAFSEIPQGVGLHLYGNQNDITQASDIATSGEGAIGVRIDGIKNKYTLAGGNKIQTKGKDNLGIAVTWGQNHTVNIEQGASVIADGEDGKAVSFDFGSNLFGSLDAVRGSYINYDAELGYNKAPHTETSSALVDSFNVAGILQGSEAAIYISDNAHVKDINILDGAQIDGDIVSEWNSVQSGSKAKVQIDTGYYWKPVNPDDVNQIYFTDINIASAFSGTINGSIIGDSEIFNTLKLNNFGALTITGNTVEVYTINNTGIINLNEADLSIQSGQIIGDGTLNIAQKLTVDADLKEIDNTVNLVSGALFSTMNDGIQKVDFHKLNADNAKLAFDIGDTYFLKNASTTNTASIAQIKADEEIAKQLADDRKVELFISSNTLDLGTSSANLYYSGNKYTLTQNTIDKRLLDINLTATNVELSDAVEDETTSNYIVTEDKLSKDAGTVKGDDFEIRGKGIDVNGNKGLVIDGTLNINGTKLTTDIFGASDSNLSLINGGTLLVDASEKGITLGQTGETAVQINNGKALFKAASNKISVAGDIKGSDNQTDTLILAGQNIYLNNIQNVNIDIRNDSTDLNGTSTDSIWQVNNGVLNIQEDAFLDSDGSNQIVANGGAVNLANGEANDINLSKMVLNKALETAIDVDLKALETDRFVFRNSSDLETNDHMIYISEMNLLNSNVILSDQVYAIPFVGTEYGSEELLDNVVLGIEADTIVSPIFNYQLDYQKENNTGNIVLSRGSASDYRSYNSSALVAPVAAQAGSYLAQLNIFDKALSGLDTMMLPKPQPYRYRGIASGDQPARFGYGAIWFNPSYTHERVDLKKGPGVKNNMYTALAGRDSGLRSFSGWNYQYSVYAGYNGSHQRYDGNSIHQNGGIIGATGAWYRNNFFTALTADAGISFAKARTMYGNENFKTINAGIASKTGYNWILANGKFVIQPNYLMSYNYIKTLKYKNAAHVHIKPSPLHAFNIAPGIKTAFNLMNGWNPYAEATMVWNLMDKAKFKAQNVKMPEISVKPYVKYGLGLQKIWVSKVSAFGEVMRLDGGREGFDFTAGFKWTFN